MKKVIYLLLGIWSAIAGFLSPVWLTLTVLNLTGLIYQYDHSMDEGTALILGLIMLFIWVLFALIPCIIFLKKMRLLGRKVLAWSIIGLVVLTLTYCGFFYCITENSIRCGYYNTNLLMHSINCKYIPKQKC